MRDINLRARTIAFYLPQYHPIPENDRVWGKGFTEWTHVTTAKPLFEGHHQPNLPGELGFYDLRLPEARAAQADLARSHGIEGFCYWHYWLGNGRRLLERPFEEVLHSGNPNFPFCLAWANHSWHGRFFGSKKIQIEQEYPGREDYIDHFNYLLRAFSDSRYIMVNGKPLIYIFAPKALPEPKLLVDLWQDLAIKNGLNGLHMVGEALSEDECKDLGFDAYAYSRHRAIGGDKSQLLNEQMANQKGILNAPRHFSVFPYELAKQYFLKPGVSPINEIPSVVPNWDSTPRLGADGVVIYGSTPSLFQDHLKEALEKVRYKPAEQRILFVKSWNEWAEGNYLEPDLRNGTAYLEILRDELYA
jgi:hypothetical protein